MGGGDPMVGLTVSPDQGLVTLCSNVLVNIMNFDVIGFIGNTKSTYIRNVH